MKKPTLFVLFALNLLALLTTAQLWAQMTPTEAGYLDAVVDFGADNTGSTVTTTQLQAAIDGAIAQKKPLFIPAGTYLVDGTLVVENDTPNREDQYVFIQGSSKDPTNRTTILLQSGSFTDPANPQIVLQHKGWADENYPDTFNRSLSSVDIKIENNNAGAVGLRWRGAEGCGLFDVNIDVTGGLYGMDALAGSGGSSADLSITGGEYGIYLENSDAQPSPTLTNVRFENQNIAAISATTVRGPITITGASFKMKNGVPIAKLQRSRGWGADYQFAPGGNLIITDASIEYPSQAASNLVVSFPDNRRDNSVFFDNVYVQNAANILTMDETIASNPSGWRKFKYLAYSSGVYQNSVTNLGQDESIYINGIEQAGQTYTEHTDGDTPPSNLLTRHGWGDTFPSFESTGAINVADYSAQVDNGDWSPAFNAAIADAEANGGNVVFVPKGEYHTYDTIHLRAHTALVGVGHHASYIWAKDEAGRRFGNSTDSWNDPKPMIDTPDDPSATCLLSDLSIKLNGPYDNIAHSPEATAAYSLLWRAGNNSVIRNIDYWRVNTTTYRAAFVLNGQLKKDSWMGLRSIASPSTIGGFDFTSESKLSYHISNEIPSRILMDKADENYRLLTRSMPEPQHNHSTNSIEIPNLTITKSGGGSFNLSSLKLANGAWTAELGADVTIVGTGGNGNTQVISLNGYTRNQLQTVTLNWTGVTQVQLTSSVPFAVDDVTLDGTTLDFEAVTMDAITEDVDWDHWFSGYANYYSPMFEMAHSYATIEGGVKWYNHFKHGSTWLRITEPYIYVDNDPDDIVSFYHAHAQHSENFYKFKFVNAHNVSIFGAKTENALEFVRAENSDNIRCYGHGGMTTPPSGTASYRFVDTTNFMIASTTEENYNADNCPFCGMGDAMLPQTVFGTYEDIQEVISGVTTTPDQKDSPIMYKRGNPRDPWSPTCSTPNLVAVTGGTGTGEYCPGDMVMISTTIPECKTFNQWTGDTSSLTDPSSPTQTFTMPASDVTLTATFTDKPLYSLNITGGSADYTSTCEGTLITVTATDAVPLTTEFDTWTGWDVGLITDPTQEQASFLMPAENVDLTATYKPFTPQYASYSIPGKIECEHFDKGGEGNGYHDDGNKDGSATYRPDDMVDIDEDPNASNGAVVSYVASGEWLDFTVPTIPSDSYDIILTYSSGASSFGDLQLSVNGSVIGSFTDIANTGGWTTYATSTLEDIAITGGADAELRLEATGATAGFNMDSIEFIRRIFQISTLTIADATTGSPYSATIDAPYGTGTVTFSIDSGNLPGGLTLNSNGTISGTPTESGSFTFTVMATDQTPQSVTRQYTLNVAIGAGFLEPNFSGTDITQSTPWTATNAKAGNMTYSGLSIGGHNASGTDARAPSIANKFAFWAPNYGSVRTDLAHSVTNDYYVSFTVTPDSGYALDLNGATIALELERSGKDNNGYNAPIGLALMTSIGGFNAGNEVDDQTISALNDYSVKNITLTLPSTDYGSISAPLELRLYFYQGQWNTNQQISINSLSMTGAVNSLSSLSGYDDWATNDIFWGGADSTPTGDPDGDGIKNLLEYAYNTNPLASGTGEMPTVALVNDAGQDYVAITYRKNTNATDVTFSIETCNDLSSWSPYLLVPADISTTTIDNNTEAVTARKEINTGEKLFLRIKVEK